MNTLTEEENSLVFVDVFRLPAGLWKYNIGVTLDFYWSFLTE